MSETATYTFVVPANPPLPPYIQGPAGEAIPLDPGNMDYVAFKAWLAEGNTPAGAAWPPEGGAP